MLPARRDVEPEYASYTECRGRHGAEIRNIKAIVGAERHATRHIETRDHIFDLSRMPDAYDLALPESRKPGRIGQLQRVEQTIRAEIDRHHRGKPGLGIHDVVARSPIPLRNRRWPMWPSEAEISMICLIAPLGPTDSTCPWYPTSATAMRSP